MAPLKVVVTGASTGIGRATALRFAKDSHDVFATARSHAKLSETVKLASAQGLKIHKGIGDVGVKADVERNYDEAIKALGGHIDVLVLNAGIFWLHPLEDHSEEEYDNIFNTNVKGVFLWLRAALPAFKARDQSGGMCMVGLSKSNRFFQVKSMKTCRSSKRKGRKLFTPAPNGRGEEARIRADYYHQQRRRAAVIAPGCSIYSASKYALTGMAEGVCMEVKGTGIKVTSVFPGNVDTPLWSGDKMGDPADTRKNYALDLVLTAEDIADTVANVAYQSPRSDIDWVRVWPYYGHKSAAH